MLVWALDRLIGEGVAAVFVNIQKLLRYDVQVVSYTEPQFCTTGPAGQLMISIATWIVQQERIRISERTKAGLAKARAKGKLLGRPWNRMFHARRASPSGTEKAAERADGNDDALGTLDPVWTRPIKDEGP